MPTAASLTFLPMRFSDMPFRITLPPSGLSGVVTCVNEIEPYQIINGITTTYPKIYLYANIKPDASGYDVDFSGVFFNHAAYNIPVPEPNQGTIIEESKHFLFYRHKYWYERPNEAPTSPTETTDTLPVMRGGVGWPDFTVWQHNFFTDYQKDARRFLTWQPNNKTIADDQEEFLYFLVNFTPIPSQIKLWVSVTYTDGTSDLTVAMFKSGLSQYRHYAIPVGYKALRLHLRSKAVSSYSVYLTNENDQTVSETRTYQVDDLYYENPVKLLFQNSLGGFDTLRFTGNISKTQKTTRQIAQAIIPKDVTKTFLQNFPINLQGTPGISIGTGPMQPDGWLSYLQELDLSQRIFELSPKGLVGLTLEESTTIPTYIRNQKVEFTTFKFSYHFSNQNHSDIPPPPVVDIVVPPPPPDPVVINLTALKDFNNRTPANAAVIRVTVGVTNNHSATVTNVVMTDVIPTGLAWQSTTDTRVTHVGATVTITFPEILSGATELAEFWVTVTATAGTNVVNTVTIDSCAEGDVATTHDTATRDITVAGSTAPEGGDGAAAGFPDPAKTQLGFTIFNNIATSGNDWNVFTNMVTTAKNEGFTLVKLRIGWTDLMPNSPSDTINWTGIDAYVNYVLAKNMLVELNLELLRIDQRHLNGTEKFSNFYPDADIMRYQDGTLANFLGTNVMCSFQSTTGIPHIIDFCDQVANHFEALQAANKIYGVNIYYGDNAEQCMPSDPATSKTTDYGSVTIAAYRDWLLEKYGTIGALNAAHLTSYTLFSQVNPPYPIINGGTQNGIFDTVPGEDWLGFRFQSQKEFFDAISATFKAVNSSYKMHYTVASLGGYQAVNLQSSVDVETAMANAEGCYSSDKGFGNDKKIFAIDLFKGTHPTKRAATEVDLTDVYTNGMYYDAFRVPKLCYQHGASAVYFVLFYLPSQLTDLHNYIAPLVLDYVQQPIASRSPASTLNYNTTDLLQGNEYTAIAWLTSSGSDRATQVNVVQNNDLY